MAVVRHTAWLLPGRLDYFIGVSRRHLKNASEAPGLSVASLYMHHIYNDQKKRFIRKEARRLGLTGLYLWGKPGRVLVEGDSRAVIEFVESVKGLRWQVCQLQDTWPLAARHFDGFAESDSDRRFRESLLQRGQELEAVLETLRAAERL
eukprot:gnl/TRDRNA2_/TRDRNA2_154591_c0_seq1.p1 gnl/TRDRNA2_/TRDRNA2_154591_c0~~gnl/TRDRNA2_/TRDRNA2_154591_c0_seq1.p1  ORF type:complete len:149 (+),score=24.07 gnl/TRDRNA2_/TRDRNA2_154591_c0_seq1:64-510(+)